MDTRTLSLLLDYFRELNNEIFYLILIVSTLFLYTLHTSLFPPTFVSQVLFGGAFLFLLVLFAFSQLKLKRLEQLIKTELAK